MKDGYICFFQASMVGILAEKKEFFPSVFGVFLGRMVFQVSEVV